MRVLFSSSPAYGHVVPMVPLARAVIDDGSSAVFATAGEFTETVRPAGLIAAGPAFSGLTDEFSASTQFGNVTQLGELEFAEMFARVRIQMTFGAALAAGREIDADLVVAEREDTVGPMVAAALGVPWARVLLGADLPSAIGAAIAARAQQIYASVGLAVEDPVAVLDPWPAVLQPPGWTPEPGRIVMRPDPLGASGPLPPSLQRKDARPRVLVSPGTIASDDEAVDAIVRSLLELDVEITLTGKQGRPWPLTTSDDRVRQVAFVPLAHLLQDTDFAVIGGGSGTVSGVMAAGIPSVVIPLVFDQDNNSWLADQTGAALRVERPADAGQGVAALLADGKYEKAARHVAKSISGMPGANVAWRSLKAALKDKSSAAVVCRI